MAPVSQVSTDEKNNISGGTMMMMMMMMNREKKMIGCNTVLWEVKSSIRGVMAELQALSNTEKTVISLGTGDPTAHPQFLGRRPLFIDSLSSAFTSSVSDSYAPSFGLPSARRHDARPNQMLSSYPMSSGGGEDPSRRSFLTTFRRKKKTTTGPPNRESSTATSTSTVLPSPPPPPPPQASPSFAAPPSYSQAFHSPETAHTTPFYPYHSYPSQPAPPPPYYHPAFIQPSYYPPPPPTHTPGPSSSDRGAGESDRRIYLVPEGDTFNPSKQATHKIRDIIRSKFDAPYISWKKIPPAVRDMWFREFEKDFRWLPEHNDRIRRNFERRGSTRLRDMFTDIRKSGERPLWIGEEVWGDLNAQWGSPEYARRREQNKQNRASDVGGIGSSLHTGGSVPHTEHRRRMKEMLGREPSILELHTRTHQRQEDQQWVDSRSRQAYDEYTRLSQSQSSGEHSGRSDFDLWREAVGGKKKGRIYGLGSQGIAFDSQSSHSGSTESTTEDINALRKQVAAFTEDMNARMLAMQAAFQAEIQGLRAEQHRGKEKVQESSEDEETEDDDNSD